MSLGRVIDSSQKCHTKHTLPNQLQGARLKTQKCHFRNAPASFWVKRLAQQCRHLSTQGRGQEQRSEMSIHHRLSHHFYLVPYYRRRNAFTQAAPRGGSITILRSVKRYTPFPTSYRGPFAQRRNAIETPPPPNLGHRRNAEMPIEVRPITRGQPVTAAMPHHTRLATKKDVLWIKDTKTKPSQ